MQKINVALSKEVAKLIVNECRDHRLGMVTVSEVSTSCDLRFAKVYVTVLEDDKKQQSLEVLNKASAFFQAMLAKNLVLPRVPKIEVYL